MATGVRLVLTFQCHDGKEHDFGFQYAKEEPTDNQISTLSQAMITNGSIFKYMPSVIKAAKTVVTSENHFVVD